MTKNRVVTLIALLILVATVTVVLGLWYVKNSVDTETAVLPTPEVSQESTTPPELVNIVTGTIKSVAEDTFIVTTYAPNDQSLSERTVTVGPETVISRIARPDPDLLKKEMDEFQKKMIAYEETVAKVGSSTESVGVRPVRPAVFSREIVDITALEPGQDVSIVAQADIRTEKSFTAVSIEVLSSSSGLSESGEAQ